MEYNIPGFDAWYDGGMSIAKDIVRIFANSRDFTLTSYAGQEDFYEQYLTKYADFISVYMGEANLKGINVDANLAVLNNIKSALDILLERRILNYAHFLGAYMQVFIYIDRLRGLEKEDFYYYISRAKIDGTTSVGQIITILDDYYHTHPRVVPFTSRSGAFGMNTFLFLYFNHIYPVAASTDVYPVHNGMFPGSVSTMHHDYTHLIGLRLLDGTQHSDPGIRLMLGSHEPTEGAAAYYNRLKYLYESIIRNKTELGGDTVKILIFMIFVYTHERSTMITCPDMNIRFTSFDELPALLRNKTYTPERYGLNGDLVRAFNNDNDDGRGIPDAAKYVVAVFKEAHSIMCKLWSN